MALLNLQTGSQEQTTKGQEQQGRGLMVQKNSATASDHGKGRRGVSSSPLHSHEKEEATFLNTELEGGGLFSIAQE